ncbi:EAL domain-containing protein [Thiovibrio sp. JS02]
MTSNSEIADFFAWLAFPLAIVDRAGKIEACNDDWLAFLTQFALPHGRVGDTLAGLVAARAGSEKIETFFRGGEKSLACTLYLAENHSPATLRLVRLPARFGGFYAAELHAPCTDPSILGSEERLRSLLDAMPDIVCFKDGEGRWLEANKADLDLFQLTGIDYRGKTDADLAAFSPFYREAFLACEQSDNTAWQSGKVLQGEEIIPLAAGGYKALEIYKIPLFHQDGSRKGLVVLGRDITSYKVTQDILLRLRRQQEIVQKLLQISFKDASLLDQLREALDLIVEIPWLPLTAKGGIFLLDRARPETLSLSVHKNMDPALLRECGTISFGECLCGRAAQERRFIFAPHLPEEHLSRYQGMDDQSHYIIPITKEEQTLGVLMLYAEAGHACSEPEQQFLETVAQTLALLIERQQAAQRLLSSEANLSKAQQIAQLGYWDWHIPENTLLWSAEVYRIFGLSPEETAPSYEKFLSHVHPDDRRKVQDAVQHSLETRAPYSINHRIILDGAFRELHAEGEVEFAENGTPVRMFGTVQDITLLKKSEEQLAQAARVFDSSIEGITITDANGIIQSVNRAFTHITGYRAEEAIGKRPSILKSDRHDAKFYQDMWSTLLTAGRWEGEIWNRRKNGEVYPEWLTITAITDDYGQLTHHVAVFHDMSQLRSYEEQLHFHSYHDALTSLPNRQLMLDRLTVAIGHAQRSGKHVAALVIDLDNFKHINDSLGHTVGDVLLQQVAERLKTCLPADNTVARLGGDDFAVLVEECADEKEAVLLAEKIIDAFIAPFNLTIYESFVTVSIGITYSPTDGNDAETLLKNAELAMYRAKDEGKNKYQLFTKAMNAAVVHRLSLENNLRKALERNEFLVYYQPKVSVASREITGMEALIRWKTKDGRLVSPLDFIPLAEETGLIVAIGEYVLRQACLDTKRWLGQKNDLTVAVNLSTRQFMQEGLVQRVSQIVEETGLPISRLALEITESAVMANEQTALALLLELKELGVCLALDDFGTGYSSLHYLRRLPINTLKVDRSFIKDLPHEENSVAIATTILALAQALKLEVVAEGVETVEQLAFLRKLNCTEIQGFLYSPPLTAEAFGELLQKKNPFGSTA